MFPETSLHPESSSGDKKERVDVVEILNALSVTARAGRRERDGSYAVRARSADVCLDNDGPFIDASVPLWPTRGCADSVTVAFLSGF